MQADLHRMHALACHQRLIGTSCCNDTDPDGGLLATPHALSLPGHCEIWEYCQSTSQVSSLSITQSQCGVQDAVEEALGFDVELAMVMANRPQDEPSLQRKLWLSIAKYMIAQQPQQGAGSQAVRCPPPPPPLHPPLPSSPIPFLYPITCAPPPLLGPSSSLMDQRARSRSR